MFSKNKREKAYFIKGDKSGKAYECQCDALTEAHGKEVEYKGHLVPYYCSSDGMVYWTTDKQKVLDYETKLQSEIGYAKEFIEKSKGKLLMDKETLEAFRNGEIGYSLNCYTLIEVENERETSKWYRHISDIEYEDHQTLNFYSFSFGDRYTSHYSRSFQDRSEGMSCVRKFLDSLVEVDADEFKMYYVKESEKVIDERIRMIKGVDAE